MKTEQPQAPVNSASPAPAGFGSKAHHDALMKAHTALHEGYGGVMPDGRIVDRREFPQAAPIPANGMSDIPAPKEVFNDSNVPCKFCASPVSFYNVTRVCSDCELRMHQESQVP